MAELKTTAEERARLRTLFTRSGYYAMPKDTQRILDDLDTLLAENARLQAVAVAARELVSESRRGGCGCLSQFPCPRCDAAADVAKAIAALEAP